MVEASASVATNWTVPVQVLGAVAGGKAGQPGAVYQVDGIPPPACTSPYSALTSTVSGVASVTGKVAWPLELVVVGAPATALPVVRSSRGSPSIGVPFKASAVTVTCDAVSPSAATPVAGSAVTVKVLGGLMNDTLVTAVTVQVVPLKIPTHGATEVL